MTEPTEPARPDPYAQPDRSPQPDRPTEPHRSAQPADAARHPAAEELLTRWETLLVRSRDGRTEPPARPYGENLLARWSEPQRRYHTVDHLRAVLDQVEALLPGARPPDPDAVLLAAWFHDAVYRPDRSENEERSAHLAQRALREAGVPSGRGAEVVRLVRLTVDHDPEPDDLNGAVLCDADLAVLAGSPAAYAAYAASVREEYGFVPEQVFRQGRAAVLRQLLALPRLFHTEEARERWEATARHNLTTELALLAG